MELSVQKLEEKIEVGIIKMYSGRSEDSLSPTRSSARKQKPEHETFHPDECNARQIELTKHNVGLQLRLCHAIVDLETDRAFGASRRERGNL